MATTSPIPQWQDMNLATRIRVLAALRGIPLSEVARAAGVTPACVTRLAANPDASPSVDTARRLVAAFELESVDDLVPR